MTVVKCKDMSRSLFVLKAGGGAVLKWKRCEGQDREGEEDRGHFLSLNSKSSQNKVFSHSDARQAVSRRVKWNMEYFLYSCSEL